MINCRKTFVVVFRSSFFIDVSKKISYLRYQVQGGEQVEEEENSQNENPHLEGQVNTVL